MYHASICAHEGSSGFASSNSCGQCAATMIYALIPWLNYCKIVSPGQVTSAIAIPVVHSGNTCVIKCFMF